MKKILVALCGRTPQIITETLYALHRRGSFPSRVVILTTEVGGALCRSLLLPPQGRLAGLLAHLGLPGDGLVLTEEGIRIPVGAGDDIESEASSRAFFELCLETVFALARDHASELIFSIAGGRKTMSAALALAAQCYARPQDSMFHVLVPPEVESHPHFFYPCPPFADAEVTLTPVPFFRMRGQLAPELLRSPASLEALAPVCLPQKPLHVHLDMETRSLHCDGRTVSLPPALFAVYGFFARRHRPCPEGVCVCPAECRLCALSWEDIESRRDELAQFYRQVEGRALAHGSYGIRNLAVENFRSSLAKLKRILMQGFGEYAGTRLRIASERRQGTAMYSLRIPEGQICVTSQRCDC